MSKSGHSHRFQQLGHGHLGEVSSTHVSPSKPQLSLQDPGLDYPFTWARGLGDRDDSMTTLLTADRTVISKVRSYCILESIFSTAHVPVLR